MKPAAQASDVVQVIVADEKQQAAARWSVVGWVAFFSSHNVHRFYSAQRGNADFGFFGAVWRTQEQEILRARQKLGLEYETRWQTGHALRVAA
jgi:thiamine monophosphate synthase